MASPVLAELVPLFLSLVSLAREAPTLPLVSWEEVSAQPGRELGRLSRMRLQVHSVEEGPWEPYFTRFSAEAYVAVRAWSDVQLPWVREDHDAPRALVFARRGTRAARALSGAAPHDRVVVACVPRAWFAGRPWIEVVAVRRTREYVPEGSVLHAVKALELLGRNDHELARDQLGRALAAPLPAHAREALEALVEACDVQVREAAARRR